MAPCVRLGLLDRSYAANVDRALRALAAYIVEDGGLVDVCSGTGYKGRAGLHELLVGTGTVKKLIQEHARVAEILAVALAEGMLTLKMDGMEKVLQGITDMAQVRAVCIK